MPLIALTSSAQFTLKGVGLMIKELQLIERLFGF